MTRPFWKESGSLSTRVRRAHRVLLALDFDGTLAPIVERPHWARLPAGLKPLLKKWTRFGDLAVISGRSFADIRDRIAVAPMVVGGDHGLEICAPGWSYVNHRAQKGRALLRRWIPAIQKIFADVPGAQVEIKSFGVTLHSRRVRQKSLFAKRLAQLKEKMILPEYVWVKGHSVWEYRPGMGWDKGEALKLIWKRLGKPYVICLGDDVTDEDMFRAVKERGVGVKVGGGVTSAGYRVRSHRNVPRLIQWVIDHRSPMDPGKLDMSLGKSLLGGKRR